MIKNLKEIRSFYEHQSRENEAYYLDLSNIRSDNISLSNSKCVYTTNFETLILHT